VRPGLRPRRMDRERIGPVDWRRNGREEIFFTDADFSRSVGWFTALFPAGSKITTGRPRPSHQIDQGNNCAPFPAMASATVSGAISARERMGSPVIIPHRPVRSLSTIWATGSRAAADGLLRFERGETVRRMVWPIAVATSWTWLPSWREGALKSRGFYTEHCTTGPPLSGSQPLPGDAPRPDPALSIPGGRRLHPLGFPALRPGSSPPSISSCPPGPGRGYVSFNPLAGGFLFHALYSPPRGIVMSSIAWRSGRPVGRAGLRARPGKRSSRVIRSCGPPSCGGCSTPPLQCVQSPARSWPSPWRIGGRSRRRRKPRKWRLPAGRPRAGFELEQAPLMRVGPNPVDGGPVALGVEPSSPAAGRLVPARDLSRSPLACYEAFRKGENPGYQPCRPYRDYIAWLLQTGWFKTEALLAGERSGASRRPLRFQGARDLRLEGAAAAPTPRRSLKFYKPAETEAMQPWARPIRSPSTPLVQGAWRRCCRLQRPRGRRASASRCRADPRIWLGRNR